jgi:TPR repeat protein
VYQDFFKDAEAAEAHVHTVLELRGLRVSSNREFFQADTSEVIRAIISAPGRIEVIGQDPAVSNNEDEAPVSNQVDKLSDLAYTIMSEAQSYEFGLRDTLEDKPRAYRLYKQAAKLGVAEAYSRLGDMHRDGEGCQKNLEKALTYYKEAARLGYRLAYAEMAKVFGETQHFENETKAWRLFLLAIGTRLNDDFENKLICMSVTHLLLITLNDKKTVRSAPHLIPLLSEFITTIFVYKNELITDAENSYREAQRKGNSNGAKAYDAVLTLPLKNVSQG